MVKEKFNKVKDYKGLIIIKHPILREISDAECLAVLPQNTLALPRKIIEVKPEKIDLSQQKEIDFRVIAFEQTRIFQTEILPLIKSNPDYQIYYFGLAPIPLAIDLGSKFHNLYDVEVYQYHHQNQLWCQNTDFQAIREFKIIDKNIPSKNIKGVEHVALIISTSFEIDKGDVMEVIDDSYDIEVKLKEMDKDAFSNSDDFKAFTNKIEKILDTITQRFPKIKEVQFFAAIPAGIAFAIGKSLHPTAHPKLQTYNFKNSDKPKYKKSLLIGEEQEDLTFELTEDEIKECNRVRKLVNDMLKKEVRTFLMSKRDAYKSKSWIDDIFNSSKSAINKSNFWINLPPIFQTSLIQDEVELVEISGIDGFDYKDGKWLINDDFFLALSRRLKDDEKIKRAFRMFLFHEALHYKKHKLTPNTVAGIGNFPKVLEITDYQADVYAILNNYLYEKHYNGSEINFKTYFLDAIDTAMETMWSFDDRGKELKEIQVRRVNRYLMWYWQYAAIQAVEDSKLESFINILFEKPVIEFNGLKILPPRNNRIFFDLNEKIGLLEIAMFKNNEVIRDGIASNFQLDHLVSGFKSMNSDTIKSVIKSFYDR